MTTSTYRPSLSPSSSARLADLIDYTTQITGYEHHDFAVADSRGLALPDLVITDAGLALVYRADLVGPDGVTYRVRFHEDRAAADWDTRNSLTVVVGEGDLESEKDVFGPLTHARARTTALAYTHHRSLLASRS